MKVKDLKTRYYKLAWGSGQGKGTYIIIRVRDNASTMRNTGSDAFIQYAKLLRAWNISGASFDNLCGQETFTDGDGRILSHNLELVYMPEETTPTITTQGNAMAVAYMELNDDLDTHYYGELFARAPKLLAAMKEIPMYCGHTYPHLTACWCCKAKDAMGDL